MTRLQSDGELRARARRVIPNGMYGHGHAAMLPEGYPQFFARGEGCRIVDVDGNEYIDFMCGYGPNLLGLRHPKVEEAAARQRALGDSFNGPTERMVELAELLVDRVEGADWALFAKNGTDVTTACLTIARSATGKRKILVAEHAYHGAAPWCTPSTAGVVDGDRADLLHYTYNDLASVEKAIAEAGDDLAGIMVSPFKHDAFDHQELVEPEFARALRRICDERGAALMLDDVRAGLRMHHGGSWDPMGVIPDLSAMSKAIANGYPIAAVMGRESLRDATAPDLPHRLVLVRSGGHGRIAGDLRGASRRGRVGEDRRHGRAPSGRPGPAGGEPRLQAPADRPAPDADGALRRRPRVREGARLHAADGEGGRLSAPLPQHVPVRRARRGRHR